MINKLENGRWELVFWPQGRNGKQKRKRFKTRGEAERYQSMIKGKIASGMEWNPSPPDSRRLSDLAQEWYAIHGRHLKSGDDRLSKLAYLCEQIGDPLARHFDRSAWSDAAAARARAGISKSTINHDLAYLKSMFNELRRAGKWQGENPLALVKKHKTDEIEMSFLSPEQIQVLMFELQKASTLDAYHVARLCLATGARWTEAETITANRVKNGQVTFTKTKSGRNRSIPISPSMEAELKHGRPAGFHRLFAPCMNSFRDALARCQFGLPRGQASHVLRHTFASHYMMGGGNIIALQKILGHSTIAMTMKYAHLAPGHLQNAVTLNPLAMIASLDKISEED